MRDIFDIDMVIDGYLVRAMPYFQDHDPELRMLISWHARGDADFELVFNFTWSDDLPILVSIHGLSTCPMALPKSYDVAREVQQAARGQNLMRWLGHPDELRETWVAHRQEQEQRAKTVRDALNAMHAA